MWLNATLLAYWICEAYDIHNCKWILMKFEHNSREMATKRRCAIPRQHLKQYDVTYYTDKNSWTECGLSFRFSFCSAFLGKQTCNSKWCAQYLHRWLGFFNNESSRMSLWKSANTVAIELIDVQLSQTTPADIRYDDADVSCCCCQILVNKLQLINSLTELMLRICHKSNKMSRTLAYRRSCL
jgi:hypothetical protein